MENQVLTLADAVTQLTTAVTPNLYFAPAVFPLSSTSYTKADCLHTRAFCVDIDYGTAGHRQTSFFATVEDAWACLVTAPVQPACIWHTGHGLQALYLLDHPYVFRPSPDPAARVTEYESVSRTLAQMVMSDATFTPEHLFRVPLTINAKPGTDPVQGHVFYWNPTIRHTMADLKALCVRYGLPEEPATPHAPVQDADDAAGTATAYVDLPAALRDEIEGPHSDRSSEMFAVIVKMVQAGYPATLIQDAVSHGDAFRDKYGRRLHDEVTRCIEKIQARPHVYADVPQRPLDVLNVPEDVPLQDCAPLPDTLRAMLAKYAEIAGIQLTERILNSARFHEHLFTTRPKGVMETPCGSGKSTWALSHIALNATVTNRHLYVVDTVDALYKAAEMLERLNPQLSVGRSHGFNQAQCEALCGQCHTWQECNPKDPASVCRRCGSSTACAFFNRDTEIQKPAVVMTHNGLVRMMEAETQETVLENVSILVDEDLSRYLSVEFELNDLRLAQRYVEATGVDLTRLLPYTQFACGDFIVKPDAPVFGALHYVYRNEQETWEVCRLCQNLAVSLRTGSLNPFTSTAQDVDQARQTAYELINFFRPSYRGDQAYAYREIVAQEGVRYSVKKTRFNLAEGAVGTRLWILNASAQLSPIAYPENMPVYGCPELQQIANGLSLHVISGNPMQSKADKHVDMACRIIREICLHRDHKHAFIALDKPSPAQGTVRQDKMEQAIRDSFGADTNIVTLPRGRIRGSNVAGECTFACLSGMSLFSTLDNIALTAALTIKRTVPVLGNVLTARGIPAMSGGRFRWRQMQEIYALSALDELYQTIWRTALRNGKAVEAIVVVPDAEWLSVLWRSVMPGFTAHMAHYPVEHGFKRDPALDGFVYLVGTRFTRRFTREDAARLLGYGGKDPYKDNKVKIHALLDPYFDQATVRIKDNRVIVFRRKPKRPLPIVDAVQYP